MRIFVVKELFLLLLFLISTLAFASEHMEAKQSENCSCREQNEYTGGHLTVDGGLGLSYPHALLSSFPRGVTQTFETMSSGKVSFLYYYSEGRAFILGVGFADRRLGSSDSSGKLVINAGFVEVDAGYRLQPNRYFFAEFGLLYGSMLDKLTGRFTAANGNTAEGSLSSAAKRTFNIGPYIKVGSYFPVAQGVYLLVQVRLDYGLTQVIQITNAGETLGLTAMGLLGSVGVGLRL